MIMIIYKDIMVHGDKLEMCDKSNILTFYNNNNMILNIFTNYQYLKYDTTLNNGTVVYELIDTK